MKKIFMAIAIAGLTFPSCSKESFLEKNPTFFFFEVKYGNKEIVEYGFAEEFENYVYRGPKYQWAKQNDSSIISLWPDFHRGASRFLPEFTRFSKKGTDILGDYTVRGNIPWEIYIYTQHSGITNFEAFLPLPRTEKLTITKTGDSEYGKYAEGTLTFDSYLDLDRVNVVRASARFRLKMD